MKLTRRQKDVIRMVALGMSYAEIAGQLGIAEPTVRTHLHKIYKKLGVTSSIQALMVLGWIRVTDVPLDAEPYRALVDASEDRRILLEALCEWFKEGNTYVEEVKRMLS